MIRSFVALVIPEPVAERLSALSGRCPVGRRTPVENIHLTMAFLGDQDEAVLEALHSELEGIRAPAFGVELAGVDIMGGGTGVIVAGARPGPDLTALHGRILGAAARSGIRAEARRFRPHVTIARLNRPLAPAEQARLQQFLTSNADFGPVSFTADRFALYASTLHPGGARHELLADYRLGT